MGSRFNSDSQDPGVNVTAWLFMVIMIFSVTTRLGTKFHLFRRLMLDDFVIFASLVFGIAQVIAISLAVSAGYGNHYTSVSSASLDRVMKSLYAGSLLYILSLACSKLSLALFIHNLTPIAKDRWLASAVEVVVGVWAVVTLFGTAFQCSVPRTWDIWNGKCFSILAWRYFVAGSNILTDLLLVVQAVVLVSSIQTTARRRIMFAAIFLPRLLVTIAVIVQLTTIKKGTETADPTFQLCQTTIIEGVVQCLSIVTACWGQLRPFMSWMRSNGLKLTDADDTSAWAYRMSNRSQTGSRLRDRKTKTGKFDSTTDNNFPLSMRRDQILVTHDWDINSQSSQANIIAEEDETENDNHNGV